MPVAPRLTDRARQRCVRGAWIGLCLGLALTSRALACTVAPHVATQMPESLSAHWPGHGGSLAWYDGPTTRYPHGVLGDTIEGTRLHAYSEAAVSPCGDHSFTLPEDMVFEDTAPRLFDLDGTGLPFIVVVQSHRRLGAQLAIYRVAEGTADIDFITATPFIGRANRWLAPIGAADLDGDGRVEIAYIDRPHLARTLRVWRFEDDTLTEVTALEGLTNHRIGEPFITGGIRDCGTGPEMITANTGWTHVMATRLRDGALTTEPIGRFSSEAVSAALACAR